jgi:hypothetical protein
VRNRRSRATPAGPPGWLRPNALEVTAAGVEALLQVSRSSRARSRVTLVDPRTGRRQAGVLRHAGRRKREREAPRGRSRFRRPDVGAPRPRWPATGRSQGNPRRHRVQGQRARPRARPTGATPVVPLGPIGCLNARTHRSANPHRHAHAARVDRADHPEARAATKAVAVAKARARRGARPEHDATGARHARHIVTPAARPDPGHHPPAADRSESRREEVVTDPHRLSRGMRVYRVGARRRREHRRCQARKHGRDGHGDTTSACR